MKKFFGIIVLSILLYACSKYNTREIPPEKLTVTGLDETIFLKPGDSVIYTTNVVAIRILNKAEAGTILPGGNFKAGNTEGVYTLHLKNISDNLDSILRTIVVTKHADIFKGMKNNGNYVLSFRHADASLGADKFLANTTNWWRSCNSDTARQLTNNIGYTDSDSIGQVLKLAQKYGAIYDTIMSSEYCRCFKTAQGFNISGTPIKQIQALTFYVYDEVNRYANTMAFYANRPLNRKNLIAVTHAGYSATPTPAPLAALNWGDAAVFTQTGTTLTYIATITRGEWITLARR